MDCKFVRGRIEALTRNTDPRIKAHLILSENFSIAFLDRPEVRLNQSWAVGFSILEISKYIMQTLMYKAIKPEFNGRVSTILSDTDSWILVFPSPNTDSALSRLEHIMDFSNYDTSNKMFNGSVKNRTGYLKNEMPDDDIQEVVGVRSKTYAIKSKRTMSSRCKGVKEVARKKIPFDSFLNVIKNVEQQQVSQYTIQSKKHVNRLLKCHKIAFSSFDDKRHLLCAIHSVPYGSALIKYSKKIKACVFCANPDLLL